jgi:uncharacterized protein YyaL (SSP411 family)
VAEALLLLVHDGSVAHQRFGGSNSGAGTLFDQACVARGLLDVYAVVPDPRFLEAALALGRTLLAVQSESGDFFETEGHDPLLPARSRELFDDADLADLYLRFEDSDEPVTAIEDIEQRLAEAAGALDPQGEIPSLQMATAVATYLAFRRDQLDEDGEDLLLHASRAEFNGNPPPAVANWLDEHGVSG